MANDNIKKDLNRLTPMTLLAKAGDLPDRVAAKELVLTRGIGYPAYVSRAAGVSTHVEVISVYSHILVTEAGAWEVPPGFPASGAYATGDTFDLLAPRYIQRRVHAVWYDVGGPSLLEVRFMVQLEQPYNELINTLEGGFYFGEVVYDMDYIYNGNALVINKALQLQESLGITGRPLQLQGS